MNENILNEENQDVLSELEELKKLSNLNPTLNLQELIEIKNNKLIDQIIISNKLNDEPIVNVLKNIAKESRKKFINTLIFDMEKEIFNDIVTTGANVFKFKYKYEGTWGIKYKDKIDMNEVWTIESYFKGKGYNANYNIIETQDNIEKTVKIIISLGT